MHVHNRRNQAGFSLIELLIAIAIILIILAIWIPTLLQALAVGNLKVLTGIQAPEYNAITNEQRRLIRERVLEVQHELQQQCDQSISRLNASKNIKPKTAEEVNAALAELDAAEAAQKDPESACRKLERLQTVIKQYKLEISAPSP